MKYLVPSKTFLTGEYSVLVGGAALGLATLPCFELSYLKHESGFQFHEKSPAGLLLKKKNKVLNIHFHDPYISKGVRGGFGKSTAEYFSVLLPELLLEKKTAEKIQEDYLALFEEQKNKPSGVDLLIQYVGKVAYINQLDKEYQSLNWKFDDLNFFIVSTGLKIQTHEHLEKLNLNDLTDLPAYSNQVIDSYLHKTSESFLYSLKEWVKTLRKHNLTHYAAVEIKEQIEKIQNVILAKPCGALGADVMLVFIKHEHFQQVQIELKKMKFKIQSNRADLTEGLVSYVG